MDNMLADLGRAGYADAPVGNLAFHPTTREPHSGQVSGMTKGFSVPILAVCTTSTTSGMTSPAR